MLYRLQSDLSSADGHHYKRGEVSALGRVSQKSLARLLEKGCITEVKGPPLGILPGLEQLADQLEAEGVVTSNELLEADLGELAEETGIPEDELVELRLEVLSYLLV